jgi:hypothetical protein
MWYGYTNASLDVLLECMPVQGSWQTRTLPVQLNFEGYTVLQRRSIDTQCGIVRWPDSLVRHKESMLEDSRDTLLEPMRIHGETVQLSGLREQAHSRRPDDLLAVGVQAEQVFPLAITGALQALA